MLQPHIDIKSLLNGKTEDQVQNRQSLKQQFAAFAVEQKLRIANDRCSLDFTASSFDFGIVSTAASCATHGLQLWKKSFARLRHVIHVYKKTVVRVQSKARTYLARRRLRVMKITKRWQSEEQEAILRKREPGQDDPSSFWVLDNIKIAAVEMFHNTRAHSYLRLQSDKETLTSTVLSNVTIAELSQIAGMISRRSSLTKARLSVTALDSQLRDHERQIKGKINEYESPPSSFHSKSGKKTSIRRVSAPVSRKLRESSSVVVGQQALMLILVSSISVIVRIANAEQALSWLSPYVKKSRNRNGSIRFRRHLSKATVARLEKGNNTPTDVKTFSMTSTPSRFGCDEVSDQIPTSTTPVKSVVEEKNQKSPGRRRKKKIRKEKKSELLNNKTYPPRYARLLQAADRAWKNRSHPKSFAALEYLPTMKFSKAENTSNLMSHSSFVKTIKRQEEMEEDIIDFDIQAGHVLWPGYIPKNKTVLRKIKTISAKKDPLSDATLDILQGTIASPRVLTQNVKQSKQAVDDDEDPPPADLLQALQWHGQSLVDKHRLYNPRPQTAGFNCLGLRNAPPQSLLCQSELIPIPVPVPPVELNNSLDDRRKPRPSAGIDYYSIVRT